MHVKYGVVHYSVANIPGAVARTATLALTNATLPYVLKLADKGFAGAVAEVRALARGVNVIDGRVTCAGVAQALGCKCVPLAGVLN